MSAILLKYIRRAGVQRMSISKYIFMKVGVFPIQNHYYEPEFLFNNRKRPFSDNRVLKGINWNIEEQLSLLNQYTFAHEIDDIPDKETAFKEFHFNNNSFESGDAEYWYQTIRFYKPSLIIEIGSGYSTLMAVKAINENQKDNANSYCKHICIEPYEMPWLEEQNVEVIRSRVEDIAIDKFLSLEENDILFIDSSHVIKPQGDVLYEYLELLPSLKKGVIVHIHDIFSPKNYPESWLKDEIRFWNEQYILEAFLSNNPDWKIIGAINYLFHNHLEKLKSVAPYLVDNREPGSFYIQKIR